MYFYKVKIIALREPVLLSFFLSAKIRPNYIREDGILLNK